MSRRTVNNWKPIKGQPLTELDKKILYIQNKGHLVPTRKLIKTPEQIEKIITMVDKLEEMVNGGAKKSVAMPAMGM